MVTNTQDWRCAQATQPDSFYADPNFTGDSGWNNAVNVVGLTSVLQGVAPVDSSLSTLESMKGAQWIWYEARKFIFSFL